MGIQIETSTKMYTPFSFRLGKLGKYAWTRESLFSFRSI